MHILRLPRDGDARMDEGRKRDRRAPRLKTNAPELDQSVGPPRSGGFGVKDHDRLLEDGQVQVDVHSASNGQRYHVLRSVKQSLGYGRLHINAGWPTMKNVLFAALTIACTQDAPKVMETGAPASDSGTTATTTTGETAERRTPAMVLELSRPAPTGGSAYLSAIPDRPPQRGAPAGSPSQTTTTAEPLPATCCSASHRLARMEKASTAPREASTSLLSDNASDWSQEVAQVFWESATHVVVVDPGDYSGALFGASSRRAWTARSCLRSRRGRIEATATRLGAQSVTVGIEKDPVALPFEHTALSGLDEGLAWVLEAGLEINYLTVSNPLDRYSGRSQKASMTAPMYAALNGGFSLPVPLAMPTRVVVDGGDHPVFPFLNDIYATLGAPPEYLAIVGAHDALPQMRKPTIFDNPLEEQPVSDLPYGQIDDDPFLDLAIGRIVGDTVEELSALATRNAQYNQLRDGT